MKLALAAIILFFPAVSASALSCSGGTSDSLYGLYSLFRSSNYIVLATPEQIESSNSDERRFVLRIKRTWMGNPATRLTVTEHPLAYAFGIPQVSKSEQLFFLVHGKDELAHPACASRAFRAKEETVKWVDRIRSEYEDAGFVSDKPSGGIVCIRPSRWRNSHRYEYPKLSLRIDNGDVNLVSRTIPTYVANLDTGEAHSVHLRENERQIAQFGLSFGEGELEWCLSESKEGWKQDKSECGCSWHDA